VHHCNSRAIVLHPSRHCVHVYKPALGFLVATRESHFGLPEYQAYSQLVASSPMNIRCCPPGSVFHSALWEAYAFAFQLIIFDKPLNIIPETFSTGSHLRLIKSRGVIPITFFHCPG